MYIPNFATTQIMKNPMHRNYVVTVKLSNHNTRQIGIDYFSKIEPTENDLERQRNNILVGNPKNIKVGSKVKIDPIMHEMIKSNSVMQDIWENREEELEVLDICFA